jgi:hypothetical protein
MNRASWRVDTQHAAYFTHPCARPLLGFVQRSDDIATGIVVLGACLGQMQASRSALQQLHTDGLFQRLNLFTDFRARYIQCAGSSGKAIGADGGDKCAHAFDTIH